MFSTSVDYDDVLSLAGWCPSHVWHYAECVPGEKHDSVTYVWRNRAVTRMVGRCVKCKVCGKTLEYVRASSNKAAEKAATKKGGLSARAEPYTTRSGRTRGRT